MYALTKLLIYICFQAADDSRQFCYAKVTVFTDTWLVTTHIYSFTATLTNKDFIIFITNFDYILLYYILIIQLISYFIINKKINLCDVR